MYNQCLEILLVEDDPGDIKLTQKALLKSKLSVDLSVVTKGEEALAFLRREGGYTDAPLPNLILLDLNLPGLSGQEVLQEIKNDKNLKFIPVVILTTSNSDKDILKSYNLGANCYVRKPVDLHEFIKIVQSIESFWFTVVKLPSRADKLLVHNGADKA